MDLIHFSRRLSLTVKISSQPNIIKYKIPNHIPPHPSNYTHPLPPALQKKKKISRHTVFVKQGIPRTPGTYHWSGTTLITADRSENYHVPDTATVGMSCFLMHARIKKDHFYRWVIFMDGASLGIGAMAPEFRNFCSKILISLTNI
jgi:hypothetical protein